MSDWFVVEVNFFYFGVIEFVVMVVLLGSGGLGFKILLVKFVGVWVEGFGSSGFMGIKLMCDCDDDYGVGRWIM